MNDIPSIEQITEAALDREDEIRWHAYSVAASVVKLAQDMLYRSSCGQVDIGWSKRIWEQVQYLDPADQRAVVDEAIKIAAPEFTAMMQRVAGEWLAVLNKKRYEEWRYPKLERAAVVPIDPKGAA